MLTRQPREPLHLEGGTSFYFSDGAADAALAYARELAPGTDVRIGGGTTTVREFLAADLIDELHIAIAPIVLGRASDSGTASRRSRNGSTSSPSLRRAGSST